MHTSHPNVLELIAVDIDPQTGVLSMISELMKNGNIMDYIRVKKANRIRLVLSRPGVCILSLKQDPSVTLDRIVTNTSPPYLQGRAMIFTRGLL